MSPRGGESPGPDAVGSRERRRQIRNRIVTGLGGGVLSLLGRTLRVRRENTEAFQQFRDAGQPVIFAFWHSWILPLSHIHRNEGVAVLVSRHSDGELIARLVEQKGYTTARGSSTRGGARGLRELIRAARAGSDLAITPDGPRGPARRVKPGVIVAAQVTGCPIIPLGLGADRVWRVGSWDRMVIPVPGTRLLVRYAPPLQVPRRLDGLEELHHWTARLDHVMNRLSDELDSPRSPDPTRPSGPWSVDKAGLGGESG
ncbi:MAG: DUF374 domain-containing protein [Gemmatimonadales bacterium]|nr:MAG: DUF374 domain-containing protein [Gemmatimonadales bacterium]